MSRDLISTRLKFLEGLPGVNVEITGTTDGTIRITHRNHHAAEFLLRWYGDHFIGYFIDGDGKPSQAIISIYSQEQAMQFVSAYIMLNEIRANKKAN